MCHYNEINVLSMHALIGAYKPEGYEWVDELNQVLANNVDFACEHIWEQYKGIQVTKPQALICFSSTAPNGVKHMGRPLKSCKRLALM